MKFFKAVQSPAWARDNTTEVGHRPLFRVRCRMCRPWWWPWKRRMLLRNSSIMIAEVKESLAEGVAPRNHVHRLNYKCPRCEWVTAFLVVDTEDYLQELYRRRGECALYYPGIEEWSRDRLAAAKLRSLGYF